MASKSSDKIPFTVRLFPDEMRLMRALKSELTRGNGGRNVSYSRAVAAMLRAVPKTYFDAEVMRGAK